MNDRRTDHGREPRRSKPAGRRGIAILLVLVLMAIALATSYVVVRSQITAAQIAYNSDRACLARAAASTGLTAAMRAMHESTWGGVGTSISGNLSSTESYQATFTAGDTSLVSTDASYWELPYRVTIAATGFASDPGNVQPTASYTLTAVLRLVPKQLGASPSNWATVGQYTVYQGGDNFTLDVPCRVEGPVRVKGEAKIGSTYSWSSSARQRYLGDLNAMRTAGGYPDYRPLNGPVYMPLYETDGMNQALMASQLGVTLVDTADGSTVSMLLPSAQISTYRIYTGGPTYNVGSLNSNLEASTLRPDPATNPLGIYYRDSGGAIKDNVDVRGTLIFRGDVTIEGPDVTLQAVDMPALFGSTLPVRLPATVITQQCTVADDARATVDGLMLSGSHFTVNTGDEDTTLAITGRVVCADFVLKRRTEWNYSSFLWNAFYSGFTGQLDNSSPIPYFPVYMTYFGRSPIPRITVKPSASPLYHHWQNLANPIFVPLASDGGLRWEVVRYGNAP